MPKRAKPESPALSYSIILTEGEMIDLQGIENWLACTDQSRPRLGRGVQLAWLKTLARILDQSNAEGQHHE